MSVREPDNLDRLLEQHVQTYAGAHAVMEEAEWVYDEAFERLWAKPYKDVVIHNSSTGRNIVDSFTNQIRTDEPTVKYVPAGPSRQAMQDAAMMQTWGYAQLMQQRNRSEIDPDVQFAFDLVLKGAGCKKVLVNMLEAAGKPPGSRRDSTAYRMWEAHAMETWPYTVRALDPMSVYVPLGTHKPLIYAIEVQERRAIDMWEQYPQWPDPKGKDNDNPNRPVRWVEFWSAPRYDERGVKVEEGYYIVEADGAPIFRKVNPYGFVPYIFEWSGLGRHRRDGDPKWLAVGILAGRVSELVEEVKAKTAISVQQQMHVFPWLLTPEEDATKFAGRLGGVGPGKVITYDPILGKPEYMVAPAPNENQYRYLEMVNANINKLSSVALMGGRQPGVEYGVLQAQMLGQSVKNIKDVREVMNRVGTQTLNMMARLAKVMDLTMTTQGTTERGERPRVIRGDDFKHFNFEVEYEVVDPAENDRMLLVGESLRRAGDLSQRTFWQVYAKEVVKSADEEETNLYVEQIMARLLEQGLLDQVIMEGVQARGATQQTEEATAKAQQVIQQRVDETVPEETSKRVSEMERLSGMPGQMTIPREIAQAGMMETR